MIHPLAWGIWLSGALTALSLTRNPFYLALILLWIGLVAVITRPADDAARTPVSLWRFALVVITLSALFNALTVHAGRTVLLRLPPAIPLLGGPVTLEAVVYGLLNGVVLSGLLVAFTLVNRNLPIQALVRLIPRAFYPAAIVSSIAITFVPALLRHWQQIREAQAVRGHRLAGWRDALPLVMPLLSGGLERALQLAEAMTARGFASAAQPAQEMFIRLALAIGLVFLLSGWLLRLVWGLAGPGLTLLLLGGGLIVGLLWWVGRCAPHTVYRPAPWRWRDGVVSVGAIGLILVFVLPLPGLDYPSIFYYPYPALTWPGFDPALGLATLGLLGPMMGLNKPRGGQHDCF